MLAIVVATQSDLVIQESDRCAGRSRDALAVRHQSERLAATSPSMSQGDHTTSIVEENSRASCPFRRVSRWAGGHRPRTPTWRPRGRSALSKSAYSISMSPGGGMVFWSPYPSPAPAVLGRITERRGGRHVGGFLVADLGLTERPVNRVRCGSSFNWPYAAAAHARSQGPHDGVRGGMGPTPDDIARSGSCGSSDLDAGGDASRDSRK